MSIFDRFEHAVERGLNGAFSRVFKSGIKAVDVTTAIRRAQDNNVHEVSTDRVVAPNRFVVHLSPTDLANLGPSADALAEEFGNQASEHAAASGYALLGPVAVEFAADEAEATGRLRVEASSVRGSVAPAANVAASPQHPIIEIGDQRWLLTEAVTVLGRSSEADIMVDDTGVSRRHLELRITPTGVIATDLGSTNGTFVEGHKIEAATLLNGNEIVIGRTPILFWTDSSGDYV
ncbi:FhaA domain-containing protein [Schaalia suimastitidis]|uniref:FhaA domain-containing protein n=1 Tax=Schaalia suimastitidis TaxID=121163 RepID=UPI000406AC11|nr:DUF3662 and FHA domain-containing protein [Schaalia suimastitidis]